MTSMEKLNAFIGALGDNGALRAMLHNANNHHGNAATSTTTTTTLNELRGVCGVVQTETTKVSMMFNPKSASINESNLITLIDRLERASVGCVIVVVRVCSDVERTTRALARLCTTRLNALLTALSVFLEQARARLQAAPPVTSVDVRVVGAVWSACDALSAIVTADANRDACLTSVKSIIALVKDARADLKTMIDVKPADDDNADGDGDDNKNGDDEDDDFDDEDDDFDNEAMSPDELERAERANEAINCGGVLVWQSQWLLQQPSTGHDVMDAVTAALDGLNALVDSLTASLCPPQDADTVSADMATFVGKCVAIGDLLLREAEKMGASAESAERTVRAALAKLRAASS